MSIITFFKRWRYWIHDIMTNDGLVYKQYREIRKVNGASGTAFCEKQLTLLKAYACEHVPFYRNLSTAAGFPIVNKNHYTSCPDAFVSDEYLVAVKEGGHVSSTSGSTGTPLRVYQNREKRARNIADLKAVGEWCGYCSHERMVLPRSHIEKFKRTPERERSENIFYISCDMQDDAHLVAILERIRELRPKIVFGYSSTLAAIESFLSRRKDVIWSAVVSRSSW